LIKRKKMPPKKPRIIAVDFDGTLCEYDGWKGPAHFGKPIPGVVKTLRELKKLSWAVVIWTTRKNDHALRAHLEKYNVPYDYINKHPWQPPGSSHKITADVYLDDRAMRFNGNTRNLTHRILDAMTPWTEKNAGVDVDGDVTIVDGAFQKRASLARTVIEDQHGREEE
jgi:hypothetical protein